MASFIPLAIVMVCVVLLLEQGDDRLRRLALLGVIVLAIVILCGR